MSAQPRIAIDAMGGDEGLPVMLAGVARARRENDGLTFLLIGDEPSIREGLGKHPNLTAASEIIHSTTLVTGEDKVREAMRKIDTSSMGLAIQAVKEGRADAAVSSGNTGALMTLAKWTLKTMPGIDRPALAALLPTLGDTDLVMLDLGANAECDADNLVQFAVMGAAYSRVGLGIAEPRVALLNIGTEAQKGTDTIRDAAARLEAADNALAMRFTGFIEGDKIARGSADVVVCDGFSGNIALKTIEGTARFVTDLLRRAFTSSIRSKFGFLVSRPATELLRHHLDPNNHNGAVFMGLNGIIVKSHGSANEIGVANAVTVAAKLARDKVTGRIAEDLARVKAGTTE